MRSFLGWGAVLCGAAVLTACPSGDEGDGHPLQSRCVQEYITMTRDVADGYGCVNFGYSDCGNVFASDCVNYCAFDVCQAAECTSAADCGTALCEPYVVSGVSFGSWCHYDSPPAGGGTDPCGGCGTYGSFGECCGGGYCAGDCAYSPCC